MISPLVLYPEGWFLGLLLYEGSDSQWASCWRHCGVSFAHGYCMRNMAEAEDMTKRVKTETHRHRQVERIDIVKQTNTKEDMISYSWTNLESLLPQAYSSIPSARGDCTTLDWVPHGTNAWSIFVGLQLA